MKSALIASFKAFIAQVQQNVLEASIKTVKKNGYDVVVPQKSQSSKKESK